MLEIINDFSFLGPFLIKSCILFILIGLSSIIVNKVSYKEPEDEEE